MYRRSIHLVATTFVLLALLVPAGLRGSAVAAPLAGKFRVSLRASFPSPVYADTSEPIKLDAAAGAHTLPKSEHIVIGTWSGSKFATREARCAGGDTSCSATDSGGADGNFTLKAAIVDKHNKILAKSGSIVIRRIKHTLTMDVSDKAGTLASDGRQLSGVLTTFTLHAPQGAASSWASIGLYSRSAGASGWTAVGQSCAANVTPFDCVRTDAQQNDAASGDKQVSYQVQAFNLQGSMVLASAPRSVLWIKWPVQVTVNGALLPNATTPKGDAIEVGRDQPTVIQVTTVVKSLRLGEQQFHVIVVERPANSLAVVAADCTELPCNASDAVPGTDCGSCDQSFEVLVTDKPFSSSGNTVLGNALVYISWHQPGYQFHGLNLDWTTSEQQVCDPPQPPCDWNHFTWHAALSGSVCGDAYTNPWTINISAIAGAGPETFHNQYSVDPSTGLLTPQSLYARQIMPQLEHILEPYVKIYLRSVPGLRGGNMPDQMELNVDVPSDIASQDRVRLLPVRPVENIRLTPASQTQRAQIVAKEDCP